MTTEQRVRPAQVCADLGYLSISLSRIDAWLTTVRERDDEQERALTWIQRWLSNICGTRSGYGKLGDFWRTHQQQEHTHSDLRAEVRHARRVCARAQDRLRTVPVGGLGCAS